MAKNIKGLLLCPEARVIKEVFFEMNSLLSMIEIIQTTLHVEDIAEGGRFKNGDKLFVVLGDSDRVEMGFQIASLPPYFGKGIVIGTDGFEEYMDSCFTLSALRPLVKFYDEKETAQLIHSPWNIMGIDKAN